jgi:hypothetical protein
MNGGEVPREDEDEGEDEGEEDEAREDDEREAGKRERERDGEACLWSIAFVNAESCCLIVSQ